MFDNFASVSPRYSQMLDESQHMTSFDLGGEHQSAKGVGVGGDLYQEKEHVVGPSSISLLGNRRISEVMHDEVEFSGSTSSSSSVPEEVDEDNEDNVVTRIDEVVRDLFLFLSVI